ncbi:isochorismate synthase [Natronobiforma cellulositropha]|uniref:isochorismate synthase n=1 Tax=Natronobiforma cellulositropha TaxID=1679076 RepID=UPI0021D5B659|nr:isochorismate synthase [Natronobiforma cellulositropha]
MDRASGEGWLTGGVSQRQDALVGRSRELEGETAGDVDPTPASRTQWASPDGLELVGYGVAAAFTANGVGRLARVRDDATAYFDALDYEGPDDGRPRAIGGLSFHDEYEPSPPWDGFAGASFVVPRVQVTRTDGGTWLTAVGTDETDVTATLEHWRERLTRATPVSADGPRPGVRLTQQPTSKSAWTEQITTALERIAAGHLEKVVLAQTLEVALETDLDVAATLARLRERYPNCYRFSIERGDDPCVFFGAPPERLVSVDGTAVTTEALAGSLPRGETAAADDALVERMRESDRLSEEHGLVADAILERLDSLAASITVGERDVRRLATIQHLETPIYARLDEDRHVLELVDALHPTPAVGGLPKPAARETIDALERFDRGWYAAPVGWFDANGDGEFAVGIRSGLVDGRTVTLFSGNGIVADSDPADEWDEIQLKFRPILDELR